MSQHDEVEPDELAQEPSGPRTRDQPATSHPTGVEQAEENARNDPPA